MVPLIAFAASSLSSYLQEPLRTQEINHMLMIDTYLAAMAQSAIQQPFELAGHLREETERLRGLALQSANAGIRDELLRLADVYERLAESAEHDRH